ncbi:MAG: trigger factor [Selenomonadaceae bacterium]|nr:trigger factor [Selenomonadaceae bacterium]
MGESCGKITDMKTTVKHLNDTKVEITVTLDAHDLAVARDKAIERLIKDVKVEGFRQGKAPRAKAEKMLNPNDIASHTIDIAVRTTAPKAFEGQKALVVPNISVTKYVPDESAEYVATAEVVPEIKLGDFKKLGVKKEDTSVSKKDVDETIERIRSAYAEKKVAKKKAEKGDEVVIDFVGKMGEEVFEGGSAKDYKLTLGSNSFIPGFEDAIVGHESGDKFDINLTFPKDYGAKKLAGKKATFETLVKQVNEVILPKLDGEFAKKCGPFKTMEELEKDIRKNLSEQNEGRATAKFKDDLVEALVKKSKVAAPEILIEDQMKQIRGDLSRNVQSSGLSLEQYLERVGTTKEEWEKEAKVLAEKRVKASLVLQMLAREQKISVEDKDVDAKIAELKEVYKKAPDALKSLSAPEVRMDVKNRLTIEKTLDFLVDAQAK